MVISTAESGLCYWFAVSVVIAVIYVRFSQTLSRYLLICLFPTFLLSVVRSGVRRQLYVLYIAGMQPLPAVEVGGCARPA